MVCHWHFLGYVHKHDSQLGFTLSIVIFFPLYILIFGLVEEIMFVNIATISQEQKLTQFERYFSTY